MDGAQPPIHPALRRCLAVDPEEFARDIWGRRPLLSEAARLPGNFADLFGPAAADELLSRRGLRTPFLRIAKDGAVIDSARYTRSGGAGAQIGDQIDDEAVLRLFADGATLVFQGLHRNWPPLLDFAADLVADLGHPVQINAYVTPPQSQGFSAHYDVHDVFVLQIAGGKTWAVHQPVLTAPLRDQPWTGRGAEVAAAAAGAPVLTAELAPGDALYLPRGWLHSATALGEVSIHLTVGIHPLTRHAVVEALLRQAAAVPALRESLPLGLDLDADEALTDVVAATVKELVAALHAADAALVGDQLRRQLWAGVRAAPVGPIAQAAAAARVTDSTVLTRRRHLRCHVHRDRDEVVVVLPDRRLRFEGSAAPALECALAGAPVAVSELPGPGGADRRALIARLLREGLVTAAAADEE